MRTIIDELGPIKLERARRSTRHLSRKARYNISEVSVGETSEGTMGRKCEGGSDS